MKQEFYDDVQRFKEAVAKYVSWAEVEDVGTLSWLQGLRDLYLEVNKAKAEVDQWHL